MKLVKSFSTVLFFLLIFRSDIISQDVPYVPTSYAVVEAMLTLANVKADDVVYDLGCGDGRIVVMAAERFGARGVGVDSNPQRIEESNANAKKSNVTDKVEFRVENLFETDISEASVLTLYLLNDVNVRLRPKIFEQLKPGSRVVSNSFTMNDWKADDFAVVDQRNIYLWIIPHNFSGTWKYTHDENGNNTDYVLQLDQKFQKVSGAITAEGKEYKLVEPKIEDNRITFTVNRGNDQINFEGILNENELNVTASLNGKSKTITAVRDPQSVQKLVPDSGMSKE